MYIYILSRRPTASTKHCFLLFILIVAYSRLTSQQTINHTTASACTKGELKTASRPWRANLRLYQFHFIDTNTKFWVTATVGLMDTPQRSINAPRMTSHGFCPSASTSFRYTHKGSLRATRHACMAEQCKTTLRHQERNHQSCSAFSKSYHSG